MQRRNADLWLAAISRAHGVARRTSCRSSVRRATVRPLPAKWASRDPAAAARLQAARVGLAELSERVGMPVENLLSPDPARRVLWSPPDGRGPTTSIAAALADRGARPWQIELTAPVLPRPRWTPPVAGQVTRQ